MPIYEVKCTHCDYTTEVILPWSRLQSLGCAKCGAKYEIVPSRTSFTIEGFSEANGYSSEPDDHYDPRVGQKAW